MAATAARSSSERRGQGAVVLNSCATPLRATSPIDSVIAGAGTGTPAYREYRDGDPLTSIAR